MLLENSHTKLFFIFKNILRPFKFYRHSLCYRHKYIKYLCFQNN
nr:MAG TPA: hypothetical protein [Caudoviricetes sp.]